MVVTLLGIPAGSHLRIRNALKNTPSVPAAALSELEYHIFLRARVRAGRYTDQLDK